MKILSEQKSRLLAEENGWSIEFANGYVKGEYSRISSDKLSSYAMVGLDEYCLGYRAGYFERQNPASVHLDTRAALERRAETARTGAASAVATTFKQGLAY